MFFCRIKGSKLWLVCLPSIVYFSQRISLVLLLQVLIQSSRLKIFAKKFAFHYSIKTITSVIHLKRIGMSLVFSRRFLCVMTIGCYTQEKLSVKKKIGLVLPYLITAHKIVPKLVFMSTNYYTSRICYINHLVSSASVWMHTSMIKCIS